MRRVATLEINPTDACKLQSSLRDEPFYPPFTPWAKAPRLPLRCRYAACPNGSTARNIAVSRKVLWLQRESRVKPAGFERGTHGNRVQNLQVSYSEHVCRGRILQVSHAAHVFSGPNLQVYHSEHVFRGQNLEISDAEHVFRGRNLEVSEAKHVCRARDSE